MATTNKPAVRSDKPAARPNNPAVAREAPAKVPPVGGVYPPAPSDTVDAKLTPGEFVIPAEAVQALIQQIGLEGLEDLRTGHLPGQGPHPDEESPQEDAMEARGIPGFAGGGGVTGGDDYWKGWSGVDAATRQFMSTSRDACGSPLSVGARPAASKNSDESWRDVLANMSKAGPALTTGGAGAIGRSFGDSPINASLSQPQNARQALRSLRADGTLTESGERTDFSFSNPGAQNPSFGHSLTGGVWNTPGRESIAGTGGGAASSSFDTHGFANGGMVERAKDWLGEHTRGMVGTPLGVLDSKRRMAGQAGVLPVAQPRQMAQTAQPEARGLPMYDPAKNALQEHYRKMDEAAGYPVGGIVVDPDATTLTPSQAQAYRPYLTPSQATKLAPPRIPEKTPGFDFNTPSQLRQQMPSTNVGVTETPIINMPPSAETEGMSVSHLSKLLPRAHYGYKGYGASIPKSIPSYGVEEIAGVPARPFVVEEFPGYPSSAGIDVTYQPGTAMTPAGPVTQRLSGRDYIGSQRAASGARDTVRSGGAGETTRIPSDAVPSSSRELMHRGNMPAGGGGGGAPPGPYNGPRPQARPPTSPIVQQAARGLANAGAYGLIGANEIGNLHDKGVIGHRSEFGGEGSDIQINPNMHPLDVGGEFAGAAAHGAGTLGGALLGAQAGAAASTFFPPAAPVVVPAGAILGGMMGGEAINNAIDYGKKGVSYLSGKFADAFPSGKERELNGSLNSNLAAQAINDPAMLQSYAPQPAGYGANQKLAQDVSALKAASDKATAIRSAQSSPTVAPIQIGNEYSANLGNGNYIQFHPGTAQGNPAPSMLADPWMNQRGQPLGNMVGDERLRAGAQRVRDNLAAGVYKLTPDTPEEVAAAELRSQRNIANYNQIEQGSRAFVDAQRAPKRARMGWGGSGGGQAAVGGMPGAGDVAGQVAMQHFLADPNNALKGPYARQLGIGIPDYKQVAGNRVAADPNATPEQLITLVGGRWPNVARGNAGSGKGGNGSGGNPFVQNIKTPDGQEITAQFDRTTGQWTRIDPRMSAQSAAHQKLLQGVRAAKESGQTDDYIVNSLLQNGADQGEVYRILQEAFPEGYSN